MVVRLSEALVVFVLDLKQPDWHPVKTTNTHKISDDILNQCSLSQAFRDLCNSRWMCRHVFKSNQRQLDGGGWR